MSSGIQKLARTTENAPKSLGPYTQTVAFSHYNNISAQLPIDPKTGKIVAGGVKEQAKQCLANIKAIVESIDHVMDDVVKITVFLKDISDIDAVDEVYTAFFSSYLPTRTTLAVAALPMNDALVQIEAVVSNGEGTPPQEACDLIKLARNTENAPKGLYSQTVAFSHYNNVSAQLPIDPKSGQLVAGGAKEQAGQCLKNIKAILESIDIPFDDIVKINIYLKNLSDIDAVNEVYTTFFPDSAIPMNALVQIDAVVSHGDGTPPQAVEDRHGLVIWANNTKEAPTSALST